MLKDHDTPHAELAPHSVEAEEAVLGSILINPPSLFAVAEFLKASDFFLAKNQWVYEAYLAINERGEDIDELTVSHELRERGQLADIGGLAYIVYLINNTPTHTHAETYGHIVERAAQRRRLLAAAGDIAQLASQDGSTNDNIIQQAEAIIFGVTADQDRPLVSAGEALAQYWNWVEERAAGKPWGIPTGFHELDELLSGGGLEKGRLYVMGARPGMGKTSFLLSMIRHAVKVQAQTVLFSLEMDTNQVTNRLVSGEMGINSKRLSRGKLDQREWNLFSEGLTRMGQWPLYIDDTPAATITQIRNRLRLIQREHGLDLMVLDYVQLMYRGNENRRDENRAQELSYITKELKQIAREFGIPVLVAAQLNREVEKRNDKRPVLSDLGESGSFERDADVVMFIYRDDVYNEFSDKPGQAEIIVRKNRDGELGMPSLLFRAEFTRFENMTKTKINLNA